MAVRFLPPPEDGSSSRAEDRGDLAEVIQLRSLLGRREQESGTAHDGPGEEPEPRQATREELAQLIDSGVASIIDSGVRPVVRANFGDDASVTPPESGNVSAEGAYADASEIEADEAERSTEPWDEPVETADDDTGRSAHEDGVRILRRRARSSGELREELARLEHRADEVESVIDEFTRSLYLDDAGLARALTEKLRETKRASRSQIRVKLKSRKLPDDVIEVAVGELDADEEFELLRETARARAAKLSGLERSVAERRLLGFLARRGWSGEPAMRAARDALDGALRPRRDPHGGSGVRFE